MEVSVIGGGLAGVEAAHQLARAGKEVSLYEMRPDVTTPAHRTPYLSELVCSNSLKSQELSNAHGLLKAELKELGSVTLNIADKFAIPGGKALVVDRNAFAADVTSATEKNPLIRLIRQEVRQIPEEGIVIICTGPLTSEAMSEEIGRLTGKGNLYFYDAISPIVDGETIDSEQAFFGSRYMENVNDYLNCPLSRDEYEVFYSELVRANTVSLRDFEKIPYFEGCLPVEVMACRGKETLLYGPMKPIGLIDPRTGKEPYAVIQLRRENSAGSMYNLVGFQTKLTYSEQERIFGLVPGLKTAVFLRYGSIHRNTYVRGPSVLHGGLQLFGNDRVFMAGQITGVEGYVESAAMGVVAGVSARCTLDGVEFEPPPDITCIGALLSYVTSERKDFQPMNVNFGLLRDYHKRQKEKVAQRALAAIREWREKMLPGTTLGSV